MELHNGPNGIGVKEDVSFTLDTTDRHAVVCASVAPAMTSSGPPYSRTGNSRVETEALVTQRPPYLKEGVRRLTPLECERLQGFPDEWTDIPYKGKDHPPDSVRYKALGNSMAVPVMRWIGQRIQEVEASNNVP